MKSLGIAIAAFIAILALAHRPEIRNKVDVWTCSYQLASGECVTLDEYLRAVARGQAELAILDTEVFCTPYANRNNPRCAFFFQPR